MQKATVPNPVKNEITIKQLCKREPDQGLTINRIIVQKSRLNGTKIGFIFWSNAINRTAPISSNNNNVL